MTSGAAAPPPPEPTTSGALGDRIVAAATERAREAADIFHAARLRPPASQARLARLAYGAGLPIAVLDAVLADPAARRRYLRVCGAQAAVALIVGLLLGVSWDDVSAFTDSWNISVSKKPETDLQITAVRDPAAEATFTRGLAFWSSLYATLCAVEWAVIALSRQHHDAISRDAALLTGVPPEDPPLTPRVCVDLRWIGRRIKRYLRGMKALLAGGTAFALLLAIPVVGRELNGAAGTLWTAYWVAVMVTAKSAHAWKEEASAPSPWFMRAWDHLTTSVPGFRWGLPRAYGRFLRNFTVSMFSPASRWERSPWELCGVALARLVAGLPGMYLFLRPLIPVAVQHVLIAQDREAGTGTGTGTETETGTGTGTGAGTGTETGTETGTGAALVGRS